MLSYRCTSRCRHCVYCCSPSMPDQWVTDEALDKIFKSLHHEKYLQGIHIAGGEATLQMDRLLKTLEKAETYEIPVDYVETNGWWGGDSEKAYDICHQLKDAGLQTLLISVSMFHTEFIPFRDVKQAVEVAEDVFGERNVIIWLSHIFKLMDSLQYDSTMPLNEFTSRTGLTAEQWLGAYPVAPGGRAADELRSCYRTYPALHFAGQNCSEDLQNTEHFHIDLHGNYFPGFCAGLQAATADCLHPTITSEENPVFMTLCESGPCGLLEFAARHYGYAETKQGYISKCDLCLDVRRFLAGADYFSELQPAYFYTSR